MGRRWQIAQEVMEEFCDSLRNRILDTLENGTVEDKEVLALRVQALNVIRQFRNQAGAHIAQGKIAERRLSEDGEA